MSVTYIKGNSTLHRLDARTKILMFAMLTVLAVTIIEPLLIAALFIILYLFGAAAIDRSVLNKNLRVLVVIFLTFSAFQVLFFTPDDARFLFYLVPGVDWVPVTVQGLVRGVAVFFRFFIVVLAVHLMLYTTPPVNLVLALTRREKQRSAGADLTTTLIVGAVIFAVAYLTMNEQVTRIPLGPLPRAAIVAVGALVAGYLLHRVASHGLPPEMGMALSIGFATVGILSQQTQKITDAQKARGYDVQPKNLIRRVQVLTALLMPIFLATLERSQDISIAILARAFDYDINNRTYRRELIFHTPDYIVIGILVGLLILSMALNYYGIGNPSEQLILRLLGRP